MEKRFCFQETVKYNHSIVIDVENEEEFDEFVEQYAEELNNNRDCDNREEVLRAFSEEFGEDKVTFTEDGSPDVEFEAW